MSRPTLFAAAIAVLASTGCLEALQKHNAERHTEARRQQIEDACRSKDEARLDQILRTESDRENHARANECYVGLKTDALVTADCPSFKAAFEDISHREGRTVITKRNPMTDFGPKLADLAKPQRAPLLWRIVDKAASCKATDVLFASRGRRFIDDERDWVDLYAELERQGAPLFAYLIEYLTQGHDSIEPRSVVAWLDRTKGAEQCGQLEVASRNDDLARANLLFFFVRKGCKPQAHAVANELLGSSAAAFRARACFALRDIGDRSLVSKMKLLAERDVARELEAEYTGLWVIPYVSYPVREACQSALNTLALAV
jgi:hypothetical protein